MDVTNGAYSIGPLSGNRAGRAEPVGFARSGGDFDDGEFRDGLTANPSELNIIDSGLPDPIGSAPVPGRSFTCIELPSVEEGGRFTRSDWLSGWCGVRAWNEIGRPALST